MTTKIECVVKWLAEDAVIKEHELYFEYGVNKMETLRSFRGLANSSHMREIECRDYWSGDEFLKVLQDSKVNKIEGLDELNEDEIDKLMSLYNHEYKLYSQEFYKGKLEELEKELEEDEE